MAEFVWPFSISRYFVHLIVQFNQTIRYAAEKKFHAQVENCEEHAELKLIVSLFLFVALLLGLHAANAIYSR